MLGGIFLALAIRKTAFLNRFAAVQHILLNTDLIFSRDIAMLEKERDYLPPSIPF
jgi:hypothetical protein